MKKYFSELIGTFVLVFMGCGTAMLVGCDPAFGSGYILTALAFGLSVVAMAYCVGNISGGHFNTAVTLAMLFRKRFLVKMPPCTGFFSLSVHLLHPFSWLLSLKQEMFLI